MDVWSLGIIILEILVGVPIWLGFKCRTKVDGKVSLTNGLLSSSGRYYIHSFLLLICSSINSLKNMLLLLYSTTSIKNIRN